MAFFLVLIGADEFHRLRKIFRAVDEYNILLCRLRIGLLLTSNCPENLVTTFVHEALSSFHIHSSFWRRMLAGLPKQVLVQVWSATSGHGLSY